MKPRGLAASVTAYASPPNLPPLRHMTNQRSLYASRLQSAALYGTDAATVFDYEKQLDAITPEILQAAAKRYFRRNNYVQLVQYPKK